MLWRAISFAFLIGLGIVFAIGLAVPSSELDSRIEAAVALYRQDGAEQALPRV